MGVPPQSVRPVSMFLADAMRAITPGSLSLGGPIPDQLMASMLSLLEPDVSPVLQLVCLQVGGVRGGRTMKVWFYTQWSRPLRDVGSAPVHSDAPRS